MSLIKLYILFLIIIIALIICLHTAQFFGKNYSGDLIKLVFEYITRYKIISIILIIFIIVIIFCIYDKNHTVHIYIHPDQQKIYDITQERGKKQKMVTSTSLQSRNGTKTDISFSTNAAKSDKKIISIDNTRLPSTLYTTIPSGGLHDFSK